MEASLHELSVSEKTLDERGEVTTQVVLILPVLLLTLLMVVHVAVASHLGHVAAAAAQAGVRAAAAAENSASDEAALRAVDKAIVDLNATLESEPVVRRSVTKVLVTVDVQVPSLVPFLPQHVARTAIAPLEQFRAENTR